MICRDALNSVSTNFVGFEKDLVSLQTWAFHNPIVILIFIHDYLPHLRLFPKLKYFVMLVIIEAVQLSNRRSTKNIVYFINYDLLLSASFCAASLYFLYSLVRI
jgi:hypothetical protein